MVRRMGVTTLLLLTIPAVALAQQYPPASGNLTVSAASVAPGKSVTISGDGCVAASTVGFTLDSVSAGSTTADDQGAFTGAVTVPSSTSTGTHDLASSCPRQGGGARVLGATITVSSGLPSTGSGSTLPLLVVGSGLGLLGVVLVTSVRRRRVSA